ncbi:xylulokinase, partial [Streptomyces sp. NPDC052644]
VLPRTTELVAVGAAALAAGAAGAGDPVAVAAGWRTGEGETLPPVAPDRDTLDRIAAVLDRATALLTTQGHR